MMVSKTWIWFFAGALAIGATGCHALQPHQLHKLNRVSDSMPRTDYNFSIPDPPIPGEDSEQTSADVCSDICDE